jgi:phosphoribosylglycinamide formyltransferase-1
MKPLAVGVLASGAGTNLQALLDTVHGNEAEVVAVASDKADARALERARARDVPTAVFARADYPDRPARDAAIADWLTERGVELVVLAGYMQLLSPAFLARFEDAVINVHPSLLPAFAGIHPIEEAVDYGVKIFGVTVHYVDDGVDSGAIILQGSIELPDETSAEAVHRALQPLEHTLLPEAVRLAARGALGRDPENPRRVVVAPEQGR